MHFDKVSHTLGEVTRRALLGDLHFAPGTMSVEKYEQVDRAVAPILAVIASKSSGRGWNWLAHLADELGWALVEAHHGPLRVGLFGIEVEDILHAGDIVASIWGMHHMSLRHGFSSFSAKRRRTVSRDRQSCPVSLTIAPASNSRVQRARPSGGVEQAVATRSASSFPVSLRVAPGRGSSLNAAARLPSTKRRLVL